MGHEYPIEVKRMKQMTHNKPASDPPALEADQIHRDAIARVRRLNLVVRRLIGGLEEGVSLR
jgi:hypothetical protein